jgi:hypothetical protein
LEEIRVARKQIFISHISSEAELAQRLKEKLDHDFLNMPNIFVSSDRRSIQAGTKWLDGVSQALNQADVQLVLCSFESINRPWVNFEAGAAWLRGILVIPVCHTGLSPNELPAPLSVLEGVECGRAEGLEKLYDSIAAVLGVGTPQVDFPIVAAEIRQWEEARRLATSGTDRIEDPQILCAASEQYAQPALGFHLDVAVLQDVFGEACVTVERALTQKRMIELLTSNRFDIIHLVIAVDRTNGDLLFSPIDLNTMEPVTARPDKMSAAGFARLLPESQTRLVVLATCKALLLAVEVATAANMAASDADITGEAAAKWAECFYGLLRQGRSVFTAFDLTRSQIDVPIRTIRQHDVMFSMSKV